jgi:hypothetical protein
MWQGGERRRLWLGGLTLGGGALTVALSCLPSLIPPPDQGLCGNGLIDLEAGEQCDPGGDGSSPGCTSCQIDCDGGTDAGLSYYLDKTSYHCYFLLSPEAGTFEAGSACAEQRAHIVTLGTQDEIDELPLQFPGVQGSWLGVHAKQDDGERVYASVVDEPGFDPAGVCSGCIPCSGAASCKNRMLATYDPGAPGSECVSWSLDHAAAWRGINCGVDSLSTLCEREPAGSRAHQCGSGRWCFDVQWDLRTGGVVGGKTYEWVSDRMSAGEAASYCAKLGRGGTGSLVVFESDEEREQIFYELTLLPPSAADGGPPSDFWVGVTTEMNDAGAYVWHTWDDGAQHGFQWGDHEPRSFKPDVRAYALQTGTTYALPATSYDTQLMHARDPLDGGPDAAAELRGVLCQLR